jgi:putative ABC transport system substrate-binding protein
VKQLRELGWVEGRNIKIEYRWLDGVVARAAGTATVQMPVDVIVTAGDAYVLAAKRATTAIPIVFAAVGDPVGNGLVASLAHPGGNVTGLSLQLTDSTGKRLELLREVVPGLRRLAILFNAGDPQVNPELGAVLAAAHTLGLEIVRSEIRPDQDITPAIEQLKGRAEALYACTDPLVNTNAARINALALSARMPVMHSIRQNAEAGGLISYGPDLPDMYRRAAELTDKILKGAKPTDIPVEQPTKFDLVANLKTAKALGVTMPGTMLCRADEVIE